MRRGLLASSPAPTNWEPAAACRTLGASGRGVVALALEACMCKVASGEVAPLHVEVAADLSSGCCHPQARPLRLCRRCRYGHELLWVLQPPHNRRVGIERAHCSSVVLGEAVRAPGDRPGPTCKGLVIKPRVGHRPVQVFASQHLPPELTVVGYPGRSLVCMCRLQYGGLIGPEFGCLLWEPSHQNGGHAGIAFQPYPDVVHRGLGWLAVGLAGPLLLARLIRPDIRPKL